MKLKIFSIYDSKVEAYKEPFFMQKKGEAIRAITELLHNPQHAFAKYPADFTLFELGEYDDSSGILTSLPSPISLGNLIEFATIKTDLRAVNA
jgi:hypothetical protein